MLVQRAKAVAGSERKTLLARDGGRPRLLLAEDSDPVRIVTAAMLKGMGCDVEAVIHGEQAVRSAAESRFDVIVLDIEMPIMDGITAARSIRKLGGLASGTPLMALSAFLADSVRNGHWRDTFDIALPKPANRNELHGAVDAALSCRTDFQPEAAAHLPPILDQQAIMTLRAGLAAGIWAQLADAACRDINVCVNQLDQVTPGHGDGMILTFTSKLASIGRTFASPRLSWAAQRVQLACSEGARREALELLRGTARETVSALRS